MSLSESEPRVFVPNYVIVRDRLRNPPNAVRDRGIDLRRRDEPEPPEIIASIPEPVIIEAPEPDEVIDIPAFIFPNPIFTMPRKVPTVDEIIRYVAAHYQVRVAEILSDRRVANIVRPRHVAMYLAKNMTGKSLPEIGRRFGNRDHTTILNAIQRITAFRATDDDFDLLVARLRTEIEDKIQ